MADPTWPKEFYEGRDDQSAGFVIPYKLGTGVMRGTQTIANTDGSKIVLGLIPGTTDFGIAFYSPLGVLISSEVGATRSVYDSSGHKILVDGLLSDGSYGIGFYDTSGNLVQKIIAGTTYVYDITNNKNIMQIGKLPDGTYGMAVAKSGYNISDAIS